MAEVSLILQRTNFTTQALATLGIDPDWDRAVSNFIAWQTRCNVSETFGPVALRENEREVRMRDLTHKYGKKWRSNPEAMRLYAEINQGAVEDEEQRRLEVYEPFWASQIVVAQTPAPSLAAAVFKAAMIDYHKCGMTAASMGRPLT